MDNPEDPVPQPPDVFAAIEETLMETARGRWFLAELTRRNRAADTKLVLDAIARLEAVVHQPRSGADLIRRDLIEMSDAIARTRAEIASIRPPLGTEGRFVTASEELDDIVSATERATSEILAATESIQEALATLRDFQPLQPFCDALSKKVTDIITACSFQDITGQRIDKVIKVLRLLESRVKSMIEIWGLDDYDIAAVPESDAHPEAHLLHGPQSEAEALQQSDIDSMIESFDAYEALEGGDMDVDAIDSPLPEAMEARERHDVFAHLPDPHAVESDEAAIERAMRSPPPEPYPSPQSGGGTSQADDELLPGLRIEDLDRIKRDALFG